MTESKAGIPVVVTKLEEVKQPCRQCGKEERQPGSSRGRRCSDGFKSIQYAQNRLKQKILKTVKSV